MKNSELYQYVYIMINPAMPGLLKIGKTNRTPTERAEEISGSTGVPTKFHVAFGLKVKDSTRAERLIHEKLKDYRAEMNREFFYLPLERAISIISSTILENNLDAEDIKVQPYKFNYQFFSDSIDLFTEVTNSVENWEQAKSHFSKGFIIDWLKKRKEYDALINLDNAKKIDSSEAFLLSVIVHSILPENKCRFANIRLDDYHFFNHILLLEKKYQETLLYGEIYNYYRGFLFSKKKADDNILKTLYFITINGKNDSFEIKLEKIKKLGLWHTTSVYPYRQALYYDQLEFLIREYDYGKLKQEYIIPYSIERMFYSQENYLVACKLLKPNNLKFDKEFISIKEFEDYTENYFTTDDFPESIIYKDFEDYKKDVGIIKKIKEKYPPKKTIYKEYYFHEVFEFELLNGEDVPLVKILDQETINNYYVPQFLLDGLKSMDLSTLKYANIVWLTLNEEMEENNWLIEKLWWLFIQAIDIESLDIPEESQLKLFYEKAQKNREFRLLGLLPSDYKNILKNIKEIRLFLYIRPLDWSVDKYTGFAVNILNIINVLLGERQNKNHNFEILFEMLIYILLKLEINDGEEKYLIKKNAIKNIQSNFSNRGVHFNVRIMDQIKSSELTYLLFKTYITNLRLPEQFGAKYMLPSDIYTDLISDTHSEFFRGLRNLFGLKGSGLEKKCFVATVIYQYLRIKCPEIHVNSIRKSKLTSNIVINIRFLSKLLE